MSGRRRSSSNEHGIEMTTFSETSIKRSRSGSFTGTTIDSPTGQRTGYSDFSFSARSGVFDVKTIVSNQAGGGSRMMARMEKVAREEGARSMQTATSRPGFFKKMGFDYTEGQKGINQRKFSALELQKQEANREEGGAGFEMEKRL